MVKRRKLLQSIQNHFTDDPHHHKTGHIPAVMPEFLGLASYPTLGIQNEIQDFYHILKTTRVAKSCKTATKTMSLEPVSPGLPRPKVWRPFPAAGSTDIPPSAAFATR